MPVRPVVEDGEESLEEEPREAISSAVDTWRHASDSRDSGAGRLATLDESDFPAPPGGAAADPRAGVEGVTHTVLFRMALDDRPLDPFGSYPPFPSMDLAQQRGGQAAQRQAGRTPGWRPRRHGRPRGVVGNRQLGRLVARTWR